jgi:hypothetical protein
MAVGRSEFRTVPIERLSRSTDATVGLCCAIYTTVRQHQQQPHDSHQIHHISDSLPSSLQATTILTIWNTAAHVPDVSVERIQSLIATLDEVLGSGMTLPRIDSPGVTVARLSNK